MSNISSNKLKVMINESIAREYIKRENELYSESFLKSAAGVLDKIGGKGKIGKYLMSLGKEQIYARFSKRFNLEKNNYVGMFVSAAIKELTLEQMIGIYEGTITCEEVTEVLTKITSDVLTRKMIMSIMIYLIQHYEINDIVNQAIGFDLDLVGKPGSVEASKRKKIPGTSDYFSQSMNRENAQGFGEIMSQEFIKADFDGNRQALMSRNQASNLLNSFVGILGQQFIEELVYTFITSKVVPKLAEIICKGETLADDGNTSSPNEKEYDAEEKLDSTIDTLKSIGSSLDKFASDKK